MFVKGSFIAQFKLPKTWRVLAPADLVAEGHRPSGPLGTAAVLKVSAPAPPEAVTLVTRGPADPAAVPAPLEALLAPHRGE